MSIGRLASSRSIPCQQSSNELDPASGSGANGRVCINRFLLPPQLTPDSAEARVRLDRIDGFAWRTWAAEPTRRAIKSKACDGRLTNVGERVALLRPASKETSNKTPTTTSLWRSRGGRGIHIVSWPCCRKVSPVDFGCRVIASDHDKHRPGLRVIRNHASGAACGVGRRWEGTCRGGIRIVGNS